MFTPGLRFPNVDRRLAHAGLAYRFRALRPTSYCFKLADHLLFGRPLPRNDSSGDFFEMAEAQVLDHLRLDKRDVLVGLVGTKRRAYDGAGSTAAFGLTHELGDGLRRLAGQPPSRAWLITC